MFEYDVDVIVCVLSCIRLHSLESLKTSVSVDIRT